MAKERAHIMVISNTGVPLGYIRSVSWTRLRIGKNNPDGDCEVESDLRKSGF